MLIVLPFVATSGCARLSDDAVFACEPESRCPKGLTCVGGFCLPGTPDGGPGAPDAAPQARDASSEAAPDADIEGLDAGAPVASEDAGKPTPDAGDLLPDAGPATLTISIAADSDDATWIASNGGVTERLVYDANKYRYIEVGADSEQGRAGLRFALPLDQGTTVRHAYLSVRCTVHGLVTGVDTMRVMTWNSANLAPFSANDAHGPAEHDPGGLGTLTVGSWPICSFGMWTKSPDLALLVNGVLSMRGWRSGNAIGFLLSPEWTSNDWIGLDDSSSAPLTAAILEIER
ncbi:MAG: hypothetical protein QM765_10350 [Myxococcales bacterium]